MKTLIIYNDADGVGFGVYEGDYSRFNGVDFRKDTHPCTKECGEFLYEVASHRRTLFVSDVSLVEKKQWDKVALILGYSMAGDAD